jgi:predicted transcriptional regulator
MKIKYKIAFTIDAETLLSIISKILPVDDLVVDELVEGLPIAGVPIENVPDTANRIDATFDLPLSPPRSSKIKAKGGHPIDINAGANAIIIDILKDGAEHSGSECFPTLRAAGFSTNGVYGKLARLKDHGFVVVHNNKWRLTQWGKEVIERLPNQEKAA